MSMSMVHESTWVVHAYTVHLDSTFWVCTWIARCCGKTSYYLNLLNYSLTYLGYDMTETCDEIEQLKITYMVPKVPSRMRIMLNRQIWYEFKYLILMLIHTALIETFGNINIIKANINKDQVNMGKWSYIRPWDLQLMKLNVTKNRTMK